MVESERSAPEDGLSLSYPGCFVCKQFFVMLDFNVLLCVTYSHGKDFIPRKTSNHSCKFVSNRNSLWALCSLNHTVMKMQMKAVSSVMSGCRSAGTFFLSCCRQKWSCDCIVCLVRSLSFLRRGCEHGGVTDVNWMWLLPLMLRVWWVSLNSACAAPARNSRS